MNKRQKLVQQQFLNNEQAVIKRLKSVYNQSLKDIEKKSQAMQDDINRLQGLISTETDADEKARLQSMQQSKIYQKQYQDALKKQVGSILDNMQVEEFKTISEYLTKCYEDGFIGTMFDLQGQGIPLCFPLDQEAMVRAVQLDSKISKGLYTRLGEDIAVLKKKIAAQVSRGISTDMSYQQMAKQLAGYTNIGYNNAVRITRTEGHRVAIQSGMDACHKAKEKGADVVKQWDASLDDRTRESHAAVDGEIRELDEPFSNGLQHPSDPAGAAAEVINCRCALLQRARWALDEGELAVLKDRAAYFGLDKAEQFEDYKKKYLKAAEQIKAEDGKNAQLDAAGFVRIKGDHDYIADVKSVNPKYYDEIEYTINCSHTVPAYEMRRRGFDVVATGATNKDKYKAAGVRVWGYTEHDAAVRAGKVHYIQAKRSANIAGEIENAILEAGDGSRFEIRVGWKTGGGHFFVGENVGGSVVFVDPQDGTHGDAVKEYFLKSKPSGTWYFRMDDIDLDPEIMKDVCEVRK